MGGKFRKASYITVGMGELGIQEFHGDCTPADKIERVADAKARGHRTVCVGDGVNDAPALAASDIGIAMGAAGSDLAVDTATVALMNSQLNRIPFLLRLARDYRRIMIQDFVLGGLFIAGAMAAAAAGVLGAVPAAFLQAACAVLVVMNSARLVRAGETVE